MFQMIVATYPITGWHNHRMVDMGHWVMDRTMEDPRLLIDYPLLVLLYPLQESCIMSSSSELSAHLLSARDLTEISKLVHT